MEAQEGPLAGRLARSPRTAGLWFAVAWLVASALTVAARFVFERGPAFPGFLLFVVVPVPVFAVFLLGPYAFATVRDVGRHAPWVLGFGLYFTVGVLVMLVQRVQAGYADPFQLYMWPGTVIHVLACGVGFWPC